MTTRTPQRFYSAPDGAGLQCSTCGAEITGLDRHEDWHADLDAAAAQRRLDTVALREQARLLTQTIIELQARLQRVENELEVDA